MNFYTIPPNAHLELMNLGDSYFCLAQHYIKNEEYRAFFKKKVAEGKWVTLDNGAGDHALITEDILFECMIDLMPSEVIPPDVLFDKETTLSNLNKFITRMNQSDLLGKVQIFACPQGDTKEEWLECYVSMLNNPRVNTIGMSKLAVPHCWLPGTKDDQGIMEARHLAYDYLEQNNLIKKPLHFLGAGNPTEFTHYTHPLARSTDSCFSIWSAINGFDWEVGNFERIKTPADYFDRLMTLEQQELAKNNIKFLGTIIKESTAKQEQYRKTFKVK